MVLKEWQKQEKEAMSQRNYNIYSMKDVARIEGQRKEDGEARERKEIVLLRRCSV